MDNVGEMIATALINRLIELGVFGDDDIFAMIAELEGKDEQEAVDSLRALMLEREADGLEMHDIRREGLHIVRD